VNKAAHGRPEEAASRGLALLSTAGRILDAVIDDYDAAVNAVAGACVPDFADLCAVEVVGPDSGVLTTAARASSGGGLHLPERWVDVLRPLAGQERPMLFAGDAREGPQVSAVRADLGVGSLLVAPITAGGTNLGWFVAATGPSHPGFVGSDLQVGIELCGRLGSTIQRAALYRDLRASAGEQSRVAHDLNNLLTLILGYSELLGRGTADTQLRSLAEEIAGAARRASGLTQEMLDSSGALLSVPAGDRANAWPAGPDPGAEAWPAERTVAGRILYVEDDPALRHAGQESLASVGLDVVAAGSAEIAISILAEDDSYDALVTDIALPGLTGVQLARAVRPTHPDLKVLYVTGYSGVPDADHTPAPGEPVLRKPYRPDSLRLLVADLLERSES
jgi:CheY-like chemotaxis protein